MSNQKIEFTKEVNASAERASAFRIINLSSTQLNAPNTLDLKLNVITPSLHLGTELKTGEQLIISIHGVRKEYIDYSEIKSDYLSSTEVRDLSTNFRIPHLTNPKYKLENKYYNGVLISELTNISLNSRLNQLKNFFNIQPDSPIKYRWIKHELNPRTITQSSKLIKNLTTDELIEFNISLSFGNGLSSNISLIKTLSDNPYVKAEIIPNSNQIKLTAKLDLGMIRLRGTFITDEFVSYYKTPISIKSIEQQ